MDTALYPLFLQTIREGNILPVTSACSGRCLFCSHLQNPPGLKVFKLPHLTKEEILDLAQFLDPGRKIVIGESVTRISEGEPFLHPQFLEILTGLRGQFPATILQITTNGMGVSPKALKVLQGLGGIELVLSLNSATPEGRRFLMGDPEPDAVLKAAAALEHYRIPFTGSLVAMPHLVGWGDLEETVQFLADQGALTIRVFYPGYTRYTDPKVIPPQGVDTRLAARVGELRERISVPLTLEPPGVADLVPEVLGVIAGSPADRAGLARGDILCSIEGEDIFSRVDAFQRVKSARRVRIEYRRAGGSYRMLLEKDRGNSPGFVMDYDLDPGAFSSFLGRLKGGEDPVLVATSPLAAPLVEAALEKVSEPLPPVRVVPVPNRTFGGNIRCAGLLVAADVKAALAGENLVDVSRLFLPGVTFADGGRDLQGVSYFELERELGRPVEIIG